MATSSPGAPSHCPQGILQNLAAQLTPSHFSSRQNRCHKRRYGSCCNGSVCKHQLRSIGAVDSRAGCPRMFAQNLGLAPTPHLDESFDSLLFEAVKWAAARVDEICFRCARKFEWIGLVDRKPTQSYWHSFYNFCLKICHWLQTEHGQTLSQHRGSSRTIFQVCERSPKTLCHRAWKGDSKKTHRLATVTLLHNPAMS